MLLRDVQVKLIDFVTIPAESGMKFLLVRIKKVSKFCFTLDSTYFCEILKNEKAT